MASVAKALQADFDEALRAKKAKRGRLAEPPAQAPDVHDFFKFIDTETIKTAQSVTRQSLFFLLQEEGNIPVRVVVKADAYPQAQGDASVYAWSGKAWQLVWSKMDAKVRQKECSLYSVSLDSSMAQDELSLLEIAHLVLTGWGPYGS